ncbi:hypothetical protein ACJJIP_00530 [Microbulbifer sp. VTAC004]|uniref:hypothetical protein n=1 Tax=Microbulbifer sp. VTAC004 TaxID=3243386 RepID=UPI004039DED3
MKRVCLLIVILAVSGLTHLWAAEAPLAGEVTGLVSIERVYANQAGSGPMRVRANDWVQLFVRHGDVVEKGQRLAVYRNARGRTVLEYIASRSGRVLVNGRAALNSLGSVLEIITVPHEEYCQVVNCAFEVVE